MLIDRPDSPQSLIYAATLTSLKGTDEFVPLLAANDTLGGGFLSRINMDLREDKHWSYGARRRLPARRIRGALCHPGARPGRQDRRIDHGAARRGRGLPDDQGHHPRSSSTATITGTIRSLPGNFETAGAVLSGLAVEQPLQAARRLLCDTVRKNIAG